MKWGMNGLGILMMLSLISAARAEPSGLLNDTGQTQCLNVTGTALEECTPENSGDDSPYPGQDGRYGRDAAAKYPEQSGFTKPEGSGGHGGFAFTPLDVNGNPIPLVGDPPVPAETPRCVWDRVTNLIWEVKTDDGGLQDKDWTYGWGTAIGGTNCFEQSNCSTNYYILAMNSGSVCRIPGFGAWRLPTVTELASLVDYDQFFPAINTNFFSETQDVYWTADIFSTTPDLAWIVDFGFGRKGFFGIQSENRVRVRLVSNGN